VLKSPEPTKQKWILQVRDPQIPILARQVFIYIYIYFNFSIYFIFYFVQRRSVEQLNVQILYRILTTHGTDTFELVSIPDNWGSCKNQDSQSETQQSFNKAREK